MDKAPLTPTEMVLRIAKMPKEKNGYPNIAAKLGISIRRLLYMVKAAKAGKKVRMHRLTEESFRRVVK